MTIRHRRGVRPPHGAKDLVKDVGKTAATKAAKATATRTRAALFKGCVAKPVIGRTLFLIFQDFVGFIDLLEFDFCFGIAGFLSG